MICDRKATTKHNANREQTRLGSDGMPVPVKKNENSRDRERENGKWKKNVGRRKIVCSHLQFNVIIRHEMEEMTCLVTIQWILITTHKHRCVRVARWRVRCNAKMEIYTTKKSHRKFNVYSVTSHFLPHHLFYCHRYRSHPRIEWNELCLCFLCYSALCVHRHQTHTHTHRDYHSFTL